MISKCLRVLSPAKPDSGRLVLELRESRVRGWPLPVVLEAMSLPHLHAWLPSGSGTVPWPEAKYDGNRALGMCLIWATSESSRTFPVPLV